MTHPDEDFFRDQHELTGNHVVIWWDRAQDLLVSSDVLKTFAGPPIAPPFVGKPTKTIWDRLRVEGVAFMLRSMAVECLLKAIWLKSGEKLVEDGSYVGTGVKDEHRLDLLADVVFKKAGIRLTKTEKDLLKFVSFTIILGRYPIEKSYKNSLPFTRPDGTYAPSRFYRGDPDADLQSFIDKLHKHIGVTEKFEH